MQRMKFSRKLPNLPRSRNQCERAISAQNRVKNSLRVALGSSTLEDLIRITAEGPSVDEFHPAPVVDKWLLRDREAGERQRRPQFQNDMKFHK